MNYFRFFPESKYTLTSGNTQFDAVLTEITSHAKIVEKLRQNIAVIYEYEVNGEERPDNVSERLYGSPKYTWILLLLNNIMSLADWPLDSADFDDYITSKYGSAAAAQLLYVYHRTDGVVVDALSYAALIDENRGNITSQYDEELLLNDAKRRIKVVPSQFVAALQQELTTLFT
jgi:hypothetical protein